MTESRTYPQGVTCWVDIERDAPHAAAEFYAGLFGWTITSAVPPDARDAGASVVGEPVDAGPGGRWSELVAPQGAHVRLWQARNRLGAQVANQPGAWNFSDLHTPDVDAAKAFYGPLFGWRFATSGFDAIQVPGYGDHLASTVDQGIRERQANAPEGFADVIGGVVRDDEARWNVTFTVADRDATAARAIDLGAQVISTTEDGWTRKVVIRDPAGATVTASQFTPPDSW